MLALSTVTAHISHVPDAADAAETIMLRDPSIWRTIMPRTVHFAAQRGDVAALQRELDDGVSPNVLDTKLPLLPPEMVRRVVEYAFHVGDY